MSQNATIFDLHERVLGDYRDFIHSFIQIADDRAREFIEQALLEEERLWPEPLLQLSPAYKRAASVDELAGRGLLHPETARIFRTKDNRPFQLYQHQIEAIEKATRGESFVVTSGTGSGKSFCYFIPIVDTIVRSPELQRPVALIVYPMNALANSQMAMLEQMAQSYLGRTGRDFPIRFARYTGETPKEERRAICNDPPHILLTNYMMAELMMVRPEDRGLLREGASRLFLVFDELHTYRGRQGADVAMLVRRLKARMNRQPVLHIGTSATMVAHRDATPEERRQAVADFASLFFGHPIGPDRVIEETLEPLTEGGPPPRRKFGVASTRPCPRSWKRSVAIPWCGGWNTLWVSRPRRTGGCAAGCRALSLMPRGNLRRSAGGTKRYADKGCARCCSTPCISRPKTGSRSSLSSCISSSARGELSMPPSSLSSNADLAWKSVRPTRVRRSGRRFDFAVSAVRTTTVWFK